MNNSCKKNYLRNTLFIGSLCIYILLRLERQTEVTSHSVSIRMMCSVRPNASACWLLIPSSLQDLSKHKQSILYPSAVRARMSMT